MDGAARLAGVATPRRCPLGGRPGADDRPAGGPVRGLELGQVHLGDHTGTLDDPYIASGLVLGGCYVYSPWATGREKASRIPGSTALASASGSPP